MNVKQLIEQLQKFDPETMVVVDGYEGGVVEVSAIYSEEIALDVYKNINCFGDHETLCDEIDRKYYSDRVQKKSVRIA